MFEQSADRGGGKSLSKGRHHAAGDKDVFQDRIQVIGGWLLGSCGCGKKSFELRDLFGGVQADGIVVGDEHADLCPVLEGAELFEVFGLLESAGRPPHKLFEEVAPVAVNAHVPEKLELRGG